MPDLPDLPNLLQNLPDATSGERVTVLLEDDTVRVERIVSRGQSSPDGFWYEQREAEWVLLLAGAASLVFDDGEVSLAPGQFLDIPAGRRHRVAWTAPDRDTVWLAVFRRPCRP